MGGKVGFQPGLAIISFWQGIVEIILRVVAPLVSAYACVCVSCAVRFGTYMR